MLNVIYTLKVGVLLFYYRLTDGLAHQRIIKVIAVAVACGWIATEIAFFTACRPFSGYWAVPPPNPQCTTLQRYAIVQASFNIPTDIAMLAVSLPLVYQLHVPWKQKLMVVVIFSMGIFVVSQSKGSDGNTYIDHTGYCGYPDESLQSLRCLQHILHALVYPRSKRRNIRHEPTNGLATDPRDLTRPVLLKSIQQSEIDKAYIQDWCWQYVDKTKDQRSSGLWQRYQESQESDWTGNHT